MNNELVKRTWAEILLENIRHNYRAIRAALPKGCRFLGVVKADAYGHGAVPVARLLQEEGADYLAVSCLDEALELRKSGIDMPLLILGYTPPEYTEVLIDMGITQTVTCLKDATEYSVQAKTSGKPLRIHIKLDTGMSRLGFLCNGVNFQGAVDDVVRTCQMAGLEAEGIFTHFAVSDETEGDAETYTRCQYALFKKVIAVIEEQGAFTFAIHHCANSGAVLNYPEMAMDMVRPGLLLYGYGDKKNRLRLLPCMRLVTRISAVKYFEKETPISYGRKYKTVGTERVGILGIGYADGLPRLASNKVSFLVGGTVAPQRGVICMDMCMVDISEKPNANVGDEVEIFGENNSIYGLCAAAQTIPYELICGISKRVPRVYGKGGARYL